MRVCECVMCERDCLVSCLAVLSVHLCMSILVHELISYLSLILLPCYAGDGLSSHVVYLVTTHVRLQPVSLCDLIALLVFK